MNDHEKTCEGLNALEPFDMNPLPALCKIFLDEMATDQVLEATARAITYYLDVSQECTRRIVAVEGTIRAICNRLLVIEVDNKTSKGLSVIITNHMINYEFM